MAEILGGQSDEGRRPLARHRLHRSHPLLLALSGVVALALAVLLGLAYRQAGPVRYLQAPAGSMNVEVNTAATGMTQDLNQLNAVDLSGGDLQESSLAH